MWWDDILGEPQWIIAWIKRNGQGQTGLLGTNKWDAILCYGLDGDNDIDIIEISNDYSEKIKAEGSHPTAKPVELWRKLLDRFGESEDIVYEPFLGSGTTLIACEQLDRICYGCEIEPKYCDVIIKRWQDFTGNLAKRIKTKKRRRQ